MRLSRLPRSARALLCLTGALVLGSCSSLPSLPSMPSVMSKDKLLGVVTPYKVEVVQGNVITKEQAAQVKPGMSRAQVRDILGSPLLTDVFHANRWDYIFTIRRQGAEPQMRRVIVVFDGEKTYPPLEPTS
jgi:outer membrane protein assembly factor BamE